MSQDLLTALACGADSAPICGLVEWCQFRYLPSSPASTVSSRNADRACRSNTPQRFTNHLLKRFADTTNRWMFNRRRNDVLSRRTGDFSDATQAGLCLIPPDTTRSHFAWRLSAGDLSPRSITPTGLLTIAMNTGRSRSFHRNTEALPLRPAGRRGSWRCDPDRFGVDALNF